MVIYRLMTYLKISRFVSKDLPKNLNPFEMCEGTEESYGCKRGCPNYNYSKTDFPMNLKLFKFGLIKVNNFGLMSLTNNLQQVH